MQLLLKCYWFTYQPPRQPLGYYKLVTFLSATGKVTGLMDIPNSRLYPIPTRVTCGLKAWQYCNLTVGKAVNQKCCRSGQDLPSLPYCNVQIRPGFGLLGPLAPLAKTSICEYFYTYRAPGLQQCNLEIGPGFGLLGPYEQTGEFTNRRVSLRTGDSRIVASLYTR